MNFRRSSDAAGAQREWRGFLGRHVALVDAAGLPAWVTETRARWDNFLMHGHLGHHDDPSGFTVQALSAPQFAALSELAASYFGESGADYTPMALASRDPEGAT